MYQTSEHSDGLARSMTAFSVTGLHKELDDSPIHFVNSEPSMPRPAASTFSLVPRTLSPSASPPPFSFLLAHDNTDLTTIVDSFLADPMILMIPDALASLHSLLCP
uniref:Uncharacterized protein n=1 Tax=Oryza barthii TaxID=65489 RepID=A0A0D3GF97_9ORYZ